jgi:hypothetical protein
VEHIVIAAPVVAGILVLMNRKRIARFVLRLGVRWITGQLMDGTVRSTATAWRRGEDHPRWNGRVTRWHRLGNGHRAAARLGGVVASVVVLIAAETHPWVLLSAALTIAGATVGGVVWWRRRRDAREAASRAEVKESPREHVPSLWRVLPDVIGVPPQSPHGDWLSLPSDLASPDARVVLRLPDSWLGLPDQRALLDHVVTSRLPGEWDLTVSLVGTPHTATWRRRVAKPHLPRLVEWEPSADPHRLMIGQGHGGPLYVSTRTETPHWGVSAGTGGGKTTTILMPVIHHRTHGTLIDIIDLKEDSFQPLIEPEPVSGVRVHTTAIGAVTALAEFFVSMKSIATARANGYDEPIPDRLMVIDEFGSFMLAANTWWKYGLKGKGTPPFMAWWRMTLMQGRTKNHRFIIGAHSFDLSLFGSSEARDLVGTKVVIGQCSPSKWITSFGQGTKRVPYDATIPGRGVVRIGGRDPEEIQLCYFTGEDARAMCAEAPAAPEWFDAGDMAPWISPEGIELANSEGHVIPFLPGGEYVSHAEALSAVTGPDSLPGPRSGSVKAVTDGQDVTDARPHLELVPRLYTLREAADAAFLPGKPSYDVIRQRKRRATLAGVPFPEGLESEGLARYSELELREWWAAATRPQNAPQATADDVPQATGTE